MRGQFLSERKKRVVDINESQEIAEYKGSLRVLYLFKHFYLFNQTSVQQEKSIIEKLNSYERFNKVVTVDSICFNYPSSLTTFSVNQFLSLAKEILSIQNFKKLSTITKDF